MVQRASKAGAGLYAFGFGQDHPRLKVLGFRVSSS